MKTDALLDAMKDWLSQAQLVQKTDLERVEKRLDDVLELIGKLEACLDAKATPPKKG